MAKPVSDQPRFTYIAKRFCGCVVVAVKDVPGEEKETAKIVAGYIREGYSVQRVASGDVQNLTLGCSHKAAIGRPEQQRLFD